jgi:hypothetical protein
MVRPVTSGVTVVCLSPSGYLRSVASAKYLASGAISLTGTGSQASYFIRFAVEEDRWKRSGERIFAARAMARDA